MVHLKSDYIRQQEFMNASLSAKRENVGGRMDKSPLFERLACMQEKEARRRNRRRLPWFTIVTVITIIPFMFGWGDGQSAMPDVTVSVIEEQESEVTQSTLWEPEEEMAAMMEETPEQEKATVSVTIGGKTVSKDIAVSEIQKMQMVSNTSD